MKSSLMSFIFLLIVVQSGSGNFLDQLSKFSKFLPVGEMRKGVSASKAPMQIEGNSHEGRAEEEEKSVRQGVERMFLDASDWSTAVDSVFSRTGLYSTGVKGFLNGCFSFIGNYYKILHLLFDYLCHCHNNFCFDM